MTVWAGTRVPRQSAEPYQTTKKGCLLESAFKETVLFSYTQSPCRRKKTDCPQSFWRAVQQSINREHRTHPRPARRRSGDASASRGPGLHPGRSPEGSALWCSPHRRRSPEGSALWCSPHRRGSPRAAPSGVTTVEHLRPRVARQ